MKISFLNQCFVSCVVIQWNETLAIFFEDFKGPPGTSRTCSNYSLHVLLKNRISEVSKANKI